MKKSVCESPACEERWQWRGTRMIKHVLRGRWSGESLNFKVRMMHVECGKHQLIVSPILYWPSNIQKATIQLSVGSESEGEKRCESRNPKYLVSDTS